MKGAIAVVKQVRGRFSGWYRKHRRRARILLAALPLLILIGLGWWGLRNMALRSADHLTVTITRMSADDGGPAGGRVWSHVFGQKDAQQAQDLLNNHTAVIGMFSGNHGMLPIPGGHWHYHLAFTWHGIIIESVGVDLDVAPETYTISSLGVPSLDSHCANGFSLLASIAPENGVTIPLPPGYNP